MRGDGRKRRNDDKSDEDDDDDRDRGRRRERDMSREQRNFGWSKKRVPISKSGRAIKGRGNFVSIVMYNILPNIEAIFGFSAIALHLAPDQDRAV